MADFPSFFRTVPSTPEFHRILRCLQHSWVVTTDRELERCSSPCPEGITKWSIVRGREDVKRGSHHAVRTLLFALRPAFDQLG